MKGMTAAASNKDRVRYFRQEFVVRRRWLDEHKRESDLAACRPRQELAQRHKIGGAGYLGGLAAWHGFTLPSAIALVLFAYGASLLKGEIGSGLLHGINHGFWSSSA